MTLPDSILKMKASGRQGLLRRRRKVFDLAEGGLRRAEDRPAQRDVRDPERGTAPVLKNDGAEAWDLGDGVLGLTFKTKANSIDPDVISMITQSVEKAEESFAALVVSNSGEHFCVGANLFLVVLAAGQEEWGQIQSMVSGYQNAVQRMKYARVPVVVAPYGMTLGGGLELCFGGDAVQAAAETYSGLVEVGVGLIPGGAGDMNMLWRALDAIPDGTNVSPYEYVTQTFKNIALAKVATSADEAQSFGYFRRTDGISFDRARQLTEAKSRALGLARSGLPPADATRVCLAGRQRHRHALHDGRHARRRRVCERARREDRAEARRGPVRWRAAARRAR